MHIVNTGLNRTAATVGLLVGPCYLILIVVLGALEPGFSHRTEMMSYLGGIQGLRGLMFNLGVGATGTMVIVFSIGLRARLPSVRTATIGFGLLLIGGVGLIGAGYFHCDVGCRNVLVEPDLVGKVHVGVSLMAGMGTAVAPFFLSAAMRRTQTWNDFAAPTFMAAILANLPGLILWATFFSGLRIHSWEGLIQRAGFVVVLIWIFFAAARLRKHRATESSQ